MSDQTLFLAQLIGPIALLMSAAFAFRGNGYLKNFKKLTKEGHALLLQGIMESTTGLAIVLSHNQWGSLLEVVITLTGWAMLAEGAMVLLFSQRSLKKMMAEFATSTWVQVGVFCGLIYGGYLTWMGYFM